MAIGRSEAEGLGEREAEGLGLGNRLLGRFRLANDNSVLF